MCVARLLALSPRPLLFFFNDTATTEIYTLSLHDALPIYRAMATSSRTRPSAVVSIMTRAADQRPSAAIASHPTPGSATKDRKSTRLNSSHSQISYAVFCLKKKLSRSEWEEAKGPTDVLAY